MFNLSYRLPVKLLGIPVKLDASFLLVLALFYLGSSAARLTRTSRSSTCP